MKIVRREIYLNRPGIVKMIPQELEDVWIAYRLIVPGDTVKAVTTRKIFRHWSSGDIHEVSGKSNIEIEVAEVEYRDEPNIFLRIKGKNRLEKTQNFETFTFQIDQPFVLQKESWDSVAIDTINQIADPSSRADFAVVLMEKGSVDIVLVGKRFTIVPFHNLSTSLHQLAPSAPGYDKALEDFITTVVEKFIEHINCSVVQCAVIASSDSILRGNFMQRLWSEAHDRNLSSITNSTHIIDVVSPTGQKMSRMSLRKVLEQKKVWKYIKDTEAAKEITTLKSFWTMLLKDRSLACFGPTHVEAAHKFKAVKILLISSDELRGKDVATRQKYVTLVDEVKKCGGIVHVLSHIAGEELKLLAGVAAILSRSVNLDGIEMCPE